MKKKTDILIGQMFGQWRVIDKVIGNKGGVKYTVQCEICFVTKEVKNNWIYTAQNCRSRCKNCPKEIVWDLYKKGLHIVKPKTIVKTSTMYDETDALWPTASYGKHRHKLLKIYNDKCYICGFLHGILHLHHIFNRASFSALEDEIYNLVPLCEFCHRSYHFENGKSDNTLYEFEQFFQVNYKFRETLLDKYSEVYGDLTN